METLSTAPKPNRKLFLQQARGVMALTPEFIEWRFNFSESGGSPSFNAACSISCAGITYQVLIWRLTLFNTFHFFYAQVFQTDRWADVHHGRESTLQHAKNCIWIKRWAGRKLINQLLDTRRKMGK